MKTGILRLLAMSLLFTGCEREQRDFQSRPPSPTPQIAQTPLLHSSPPEASPEAAKFERNAYDLSEGKQLFSLFNCKGCHAAGGGGMGPALMDDKWIYGSNIENIAASIREGRRRGMPSFRGKATEVQIWQLAGYIRSLAGLAPPDAAPGRSDTLHARPAESRLPPTTPVQETR